MLNNRTLDLRSLAAFRILLGLYLLYDVYSRLSLGKYDLAWYTSIPPERSFLLETDTPHKAPLHRIWFYRGSASTQLLLFATTAILSACLCLGWCCHAVTKILLFVLVTAQQSRNMWVHDGSDSYCRHLLFWSCFLPLSAVWSLDARRKYSNTQQLLLSPATQQLSVLPCVAISLQMLLMYWGTVAARIQENTDRDWLPPRLCAVYYSLSGSFATRSNVLTHLLQNNVILGQILTFKSMIIESVVPAMIFVALWVVKPLKTRSKLLSCGVATMMLFHLGLLLTLNLPNWQFLACVAQVLFLPGQFWDCWGAGPTPNDRIKQQQTAISKKNDDAMFTISDNNDGNTVEQPKKEAKISYVRGNSFSKVIQVFWFCYMIFTWCCERRWIPNLDRGDIGQGLRLTQYWVMFKDTPRQGHNVILTGIEGGTERRLDILHYVRTGVFEEQLPTSFVPLDMSNRYPSPRWERALDQFASQKQTAKSQSFGRALCKLVNEHRLEAKIPQIRQMEIRFQHLDIMPAGSPSRYAQRIPASDTVVTVLCAPEPMWANP